jgi:hypothetical protein
VREDGFLEPLGDLDDAELFADSLFSAWVLPIVLGLQCLVRLRSVSSRVSVCLLGLQHQLGYACMRVP